MEKIIKYGGWVMSLISMCALVVTIMWHVRVMDEVKKSQIKHDAELERYDG